MCLLLLSVSFTAVLNSWRKNRGLLFPHPFPFFSLIPIPWPSIFHYFMWGGPPALSVPCTNVNSNLFWVTHDLPVGLGSPHSVHPSAMISLFATHPSHFLLKNCVFLGRSGKVSWWSSSKCSFRGKEKSHPHSSFLMTQFRYYYYRFLLFHAIWSQMERKLWWVLSSKFLRVSMTHSINKVGVTPQVVTDQTGSRKMQPWGCLHNKLRDRVYFHHSYLIKFFFKRKSICYYLWVLRVYIPLTEKVPLTPSLAASVETWLRHVHT